MSASLLSVVSGLQFGIDHSTLPTWVICGVLGLLSIISWAILASKSGLISRAVRANKAFMRLFRDSPHPLALFLTRERVELSPYFHIYHAASRELAFYLVGEEEPGRNFSSRLQGAGRITNSQMGAVQNAMERAVAEAALRMESGMTLVGTVLSIAPFLGLLGTVWGLLDCFADLANAGSSAGLSALSPGVAGALLTTIAGIVVTIPSLMGYNMLVSRIRSQIVRLDNFTSELAGLLDRHFVDHRPPEEPLPSLAAMGAPSMPAFSRTPSQALPSKLSVSEAP